MRKFIKELGWNWAALIQLRGQIPTKRSCLSHYESLTTSASSFAKTFPRNPGVLFKNLLLNVRRVLGKRSVSTPRLVDLLAWACSFSITGLYHRCLSRNFPRFQLLLPTNIPFYVFIFKKQYIELSRRFIHYCSL